MAEAELIRLDEGTRARLAGLIDRHRDRLRAIKGFIDAEPGFPIVDGWMRREPAIIVHVAQKLSASELLPEDRAPREIDGIRVDLVAADPWRLLRHDPATAALAEEADGLALAALTYERRPGNPIDHAFDVARPILCHAGPDAGWPVLKRFLEGTRDTLTAAMYDLNATYVAKTLVETVRDNAVDFVLTGTAG